MKNTFKDNLEHSDDYTERVNKLRADFELLVSGAVPENEVYDYVIALKGQADYFGREEKYLLWALADPTTMPSDTRKEYVHMPTYLAAAFLSYAILHYDSVRTIPGILEFEDEALHGCRARRPWGSLKRFVRIMDIFVMGELPALLEKYPEHFERFRDFFLGGLDYMEDCILNGSFERSYPHLDLCAAAEKILAKLAPERYTGEYLFVYGTLMENGSAAHYLKDARYFGKFILKDYAMFSLGSFPGIVPEQGGKVCGELYFIPHELLESLDRYEGEGTLYTRKKLCVADSIRTKDAWVYVYNGKRTGKAMQEPWNADESDIVWYAAYGSNMSKKRFRCYLKGGVCEENGRSYEGCRDKKQHFTDSMFTFFRGSVYFGNSSPSWGGCGVAFYDPEGSGSVPMRLYKITRGQLHDIQRQEGPSDNWYGKLVTLGIKDRMPIYTFTSATKRPENAPSDAYIQLIEKALRARDGIGAWQTKDYMKMLRQGFDRQD